MISAGGWWQSCVVSTSLWRRRMKNPQAIFGRWQHDLTFVQTALLLLAATTSVRVLAPLLFVLSQSSSTSSCVVRRRLIIWMLKLLLLHLRTTNGFDTDSPNYVPWNHHTLSTLSMMKTTTTVARFEKQKARGVINYCNARSPLSRPTTTHPGFTSVFLPVVEWSRTQIIQNQLMFRIQKPCYCLYCYWFSRRCRRRQLL
jgi:hypothetical protein